jgi:hypothetical protein
MKYLIYMVFLILILLPDESYAQDSFLRFKGQADAYGGINISDPIQIQSGCRFLPSLSAGTNISGGLKFDTELSADTYLNYHFTDWKNDMSDQALKLYRLWARIYSDRLEFRAGLQKINFGQASSLRPLMWFDQIDQRDPLQLTSGVYGLLGRYYFQNNANIWLWSLWGNRKNRGWDVVSSDRKIPEIGGRIQLPVPKGEVAVSYHHRTVDFPDSLSAHPLPVPNGYIKIPEDRIGFDGKWDLGAGLWTEYSLTHCNYNSDVLRPWTRLFTLGTDYTFGIGNGLYVSSEFFSYSNAGKVFAKGRSMSFSSLTTNYPYGINRAGIILYYNWTNNTWYRFINLQRQNDKWTYYLFLFWNPEDFELYNRLSGNSMFTGKGIQFMAVFNF